MSELKDLLGIKLFGKTIQLLPPDEGLACKAATLAKAAASSISEQHQYPSTSEDKKNPSEYDCAEAKGEDVSLQPYAEDSIHPYSTSSGIDDYPKTLNANKETCSTNTNKIEDPCETSNSEEKTLKKPDKIVPCPRCNSMDTKFCYYNNYNLNQPRHFCMNCQRYWTAGGTMRNVPVGSGRRKNKRTAASQYHRVDVVSEARQAAGAEATCGIHHPSVLTFRSDTPLCESMTSALKLTDKSQNSLRNEYHERQEQKKVDAHLTVSSTAASSLTDKGKNGHLKNIQGNPRQDPIFPSPRPYPWSSAQCRSPMAPLTPTNFGPSSFPASFYPIPQYWGCTVPGGPWSMPWLNPQSFSPDQYAFNSSSPSSPLGKHSRDGSMLTSSNFGKEEVSEDHKNSEMGALVPKTLRINDPTEAAKSSIWSTLGIQNEGYNSVARESLFKALQPKGDQKNHVAENSKALLHANPAALSRSLNFRESS